MKLKMSLWVAGATLALFVSVLLARCDRHIGVVHGMPSTERWVWHGPLGSFGIRDGAQQVKDQWGRLFPEEFPRVTGVAIGPLGSYWFHLHLYQFLLLAGLPILAAVNILFSLYRHKLGSRAIRLKHA